MFKIFHHGIRAPFQNLKVAPEKVRSPLFCDQAIPGSAVEVGRKEQQQVGSPQVALVSLQVISF